MSTHLEKNHEAYLAREEELIAEHSGRVALFHDGALVCIFDDSDSAYDAGCEQFGLGEFSLVTIGQQPVSLGFLTIHTLERPEPCLPST